MFLFARVFGLFYYCFAVFRKGVFFIKKCRFVEFWHAFPVFKQKLSISDYNVIILFFVRIIRYC